MNTGAGGENDQWSKPKTNYVLIAFRSDRVGSVSKTVHFWRKPAVWDWQSHVGTSGGL